MRASPALLAVLCACASEPAFDPGADGVLVNELQPANVTTLADEGGGFDDWVELHNPTDVDADLSGHGLTDDLDAPHQWVFPDGTVLPAGGFLLVWLDDEPDGPLHANFRLAAEGELIALFGPEATGSARLDAVVFDAQAPDISMARMPDGAATWQPDDSPTPGQPNG